LRGEEGDGRVDPALFGDSHVAAVDVLVVLFEELHMLQTRVFLQGDVEHVHVLENLQSLETWVVLVDQSEVLLGLAQLVLAPVDHLAEYCLDLHDFE